MKDELTTIILAKNEARCIVQTVKSALPISSEVIVVDTGSTDKTRSLAAAAGARVEVLDWQGFGPTKNESMKLAKTNWIFSLDADEAITPELQKEILALDPDLNVLYGFKRVTDFCGQWVRNGAWKNDFIYRIFHKKRASWDARAVHEQLILKEDVTKKLLKGDVLHYSYPTLDSHDKKMDTYIKLSVDAMYKAGERPNWIKRNVSPIWRAFSGYVLKRGFLDGWAGREIARRDYFIVKEKYRLLQERLEKSK